jgi:hypothetical protein
MELRSVVPIKLRWEVEVAGRGIGMWLRKMKGQMIKGREDINQSNECSMRVRDQS